MSGAIGLSYPDGRITDLKRNPIQLRDASRPRFRIDEERLDELFSTISPSAYKLYHALARRLGSENTIVQMSVKELQAATGLSPQTVRKGLNELETLRLIIRLGENAQRRYLLNEMYLRCGTVELLSVLRTSLFKIFSVLARRVRSGNTIVNMSPEELQETTCLSLAAVFAGLKELESLGLITRLNETAQRRYVLNEMYLRQLK